MSIYLDSTSDLVAMFNTAMGVIATASDLVFGTPQATTSAEKTQFNRNTKIGVYFAANSTVGTGGTKIYYDRLDVAPLANANFYKSVTSAGANLTAMLPVIKNYTGAVFTTSDLVEHSSVDDGQGNITFLIEAKSTSLGWMGSVTVTLAKSASLESEFTTDTLDGFN